MLVVVIVYHQGSHVVEAVATHLGKQPRGCMATIVGCGDVLVLKAKLSQRVVITESQVQL